MIPISNECAIVYNANGTILTMTYYIQREDFYYARFYTYKNDQNLTNDFIKNNLKKPLSKTGIKKNLENSKKFNRSINSEIRLAGEILDRTSVSPEIRQIFNSNLLRGRLLNGFDGINGIEISAPYNELINIKNGLEQLEKQNQNLTKKRKW